jgi:hypothetical protein
MESGPVGPGWGVVGGLVEVDMAGRPLAPAAQLDPVMTQGTHTGGLVLRLLLRDKSVGLYRVRTSRFA